MNRHFIAASRECCTYEKHIPSPALRRTFELDKIPERAELSICGLGFYVLYVNGVDITKGLLAPYMSNPDHFCYFDTYDVVPYLREGENVIGVLLGNGYMNPFGGTVWSFQDAPWIGVPRLALEFSADINGETLFFEADERFCTHPSPIVFDEMRSGEIYDARLELEGWNLPGFDDADWTPAVSVEAPRGELRLADVEPIVCQREIKPISVQKQDDGFLYDFGMNTAGLCRLKIRAKAGQTISMRHGELLRDGRFFDGNLAFNVKRNPRYAEYVQNAVYIAKGVGEEVWMSHFTYSGFRYVIVTGITAEQATEDLLTFCVYHSDLARIGGFSCSDATVNRLFEMSVNSDMSNFYYFPTDCPHREKLGWTGDASMSSDHVILYYGVEKSYCQWLANICKSQNGVGALPGIIPTGGWGFEWGNGPVFDSVIFNLPYMLYRFRGNTEGIRICAHAMIRYLSYVLTRRSENGAIEFGLGDWLSMKSLTGEEYSHPLGLCQTIMVMDLAHKASEMLNAVGQTHQANFADEIYRDLRETVRRLYLDSATCALAGGSQTGQAMGLYYGVFEAHERELAFARLLECIHANGDNFDCGLVGLHCLFHVLAEHGEVDLAYRMITKPDYPSYGHFIENGETSIPERFMPDGERQFSFSHNHHFLCDISRWFMFWIAGLHVIDYKTVEINPEFLPGLEHAEAYHILPSGRVSVAWRRVNGETSVEVELPRDVTCNVKLPKAVPCRIKHI